LFFSDIFLHQSKQPLGEYIDLAIIDKCYFADQNIDLVDWHIVDILEIEGENLEYFQLSVIDDLSVESFHFDSDSHKIQNVE